MLATEARLGQVAHQHAKLPGAVEVTAIPVDSRTADPPRVDVSARESVAFGPEKSHVEDALARAIEGAVSAGLAEVGQHWVTLTLSPTIFRTSFAENTAGIESATCSIFFTTATASTRSCHMPGVEFTLVAWVRNCLRDRKS